MATASAPRATYTTDLATSLPPAATTHALVMRTKTHSCSAAPAWHTRRRNVRTASNQQHRNHPSSYQHLRAGFALTCQRISVEGSGQPAGTEPVARKMKKILPARPDRVTVMRTHSFALFLGSILSVARCLLLPRPASRRPIASCSVLSCLRAPQRCHRLRRTASFLRCCSRISAAPPA